METSPLICSAMDWFLYDNGLRHERVKPVFSYNANQLTGCNIILRLAFNRFHHFGSENVKRMD